MKTAAACQEAMARVRCERCGKTLFFFAPAETRPYPACLLVEIKCRNRECQQINRLQLCHRICP